MRDEILVNLNNPRQLEKLYRDNKPTFRAAFNALYPQLGDNPLAEGWYHRLNFNQDESIWGTPRERMFVVVASLLAGLLAKLPQVFSLNEEFFYPRNIGFIVFPALIAYFGWKNDIPRRLAAWLIGLSLLAAVYINIVPFNSSSDTLILSCIHLPLWLWSLLGFTFGRSKQPGSANWLGFLRYNGDLAVMTALLLISGGLVSAMTFNLFALIGLNIETVYQQYVLVFGLSAVPLVGTFLTQNQPAIVNKVSSVIANLFSPVVLVMLVIYLSAMVVAGKNPYQDREFLLLFNALLIGVMALIFFSVAEPTGKKRFQIVILFLLSVVTIVINGIALSAVLFRIAEWGMTPNRAAVMGANVLMLTHLLLIAFRLFGTLTRKSDLEQVSKAMTLFLPIYSAWSVLVAFVFPFLFGFR